MRELVNICKLSRASSARNSDPSDRKFLRIFLRSNFTQFLLPHFNAILADNTYIYIHMYIYCCIILVVLCNTRQEIVKTQRIISGTRERPIISNSHEDSPVWFHIAIIIIDNFASAKRKNDFFAEWGRVTLSTRTCCDSSQSHTFARSFRSHTCRSICGPLISPSDPRLIRNDPSGGGFSSTCHARVGVR